MCELSFVHILLSVTCDLGHQCDCLDRILAYCGLTGEHDGVCAVVDGICNVSDLSTCRARVADHGIEHLSSCDDRLVSLVAFCDDRFLDMRNLMSRNLDAEIAAGYHDAVGSFNDLIDILNSLCALDF